MNTTDLGERSPEEIERSIAIRRDALKGKLNELEYRLSPTERMRQVRQQIDPDAIAPWAAVGAVPGRRLLIAFGDSDLDFRLEREDLVSYIVLP